MGYCYFIGLNNEIKIGYSNNVKRRLKQLQTSHGKQLLLLGYISNCNKKDEKNLHIKFYKYKINREIFSINEELVDYINQNNEIKDNWVEIEENQVKIYKRMKK